MARDATARVVKSKKGKATAADRFIGAQIRRRRHTLDMNQVTLAEAIGVTFQQIQKYEEGVNRVSASRLHDIAKILGVPITFFLKEEGPALPSEASTIEGLVAFLNMPDAEKLIASFPAIKSESTRRTLVDLICGLADEAG